jgi:hypothetical protein
MPTSYWKRSKLSYQAVGQMQTLSLPIHSKENYFAAIEICVGSLKKKITYYIRPMDILAHIYTLFYYYFITKDSYFGNNVNVFS